MKQVYFLLGCVGFFCSCHHVYYAPNTANIPMLAEKGETRINALYSSGGDSKFNGGEVQAAHAVSKNVGLMVNFFAAGKTENVSSSGSTAQFESGKGSYFEAGGGYFKAVDAKKKWIFESYGGIGTGVVTNKYESGDHSKVGITKFFLQPSFGYKSANFEIGFAPKFSIINWKVKEERIGTTNDDAKRDVAAIKADPGFVAFEPSLLLRVGTKEFKFHGGLSFSRYSAYNVFYSGEITEGLNASLGISISLSPKKSQ